MLVSEILPDVRETIGRCSDELALRRLSEAVQLLSQKGNWELLVGYIDICSGADGKTITLPSEIETPLAVNVGGQPQIFRNRWYEFHFNGAGSFKETHWNWDDKGFSPVVMDVIHPSTVIGIAELKVDESIFLRVYGRDQYGRTIRSQDPDGTWHDGFNVPLNLQTDFPAGIIQPNTERLFRRIWSVADITQFICSVPHNLTTGTSVYLSLVTPPMPTPLVAGSYYYVRVIDANHVSLHSTQQGALTNTQVVKMTDVDVSCLINLKDERGVQVQTQFLSSSPHKMKTGTLVEFTATTFPYPIVANTNYVARVIDSTNFTVHSTLEDAANNVNPIDVISPGTGVVAIGKQDFAPVTILNFSTNHNLFNGDAITISNTSGSMPSPLLEGVTYYARVISATSISIHPTLADATNNTNAIVLTSSGSGTTSILKTMTASASPGYNNNITAANHGLNTDTIVPSSTTSARERTANVATITTAAPHGLSTGLFVNVSGMGSATYNTAQPVSITVTSPTTFTYSNIGGDEVSTPDAAGTISNAPSNGDFVQFTSTGLLPNPLTQGTTYQAEPVMTSNSFTVYTTSHVPVDLITTGTGQLFLLISRVFTVGFDNTWRTDASQLSTGDGVYVRSTGTLPATVPALNDATQYYVRKIDSNTVELYDTALNANNAPSTTGRITVSGVGSGDVTLELETAVTAVPASSLLHGSSTNYWTNGAKVQFTTDGTLPTGLSLATDYLALVENGFFKITDTLGNAINLTGIGSGNHKMQISRNFSVDVLDYVVVENNEYENGDAVIINTSGTVPTPLIAGDTYYLRRISADSVEIYDTASHAKNLASTTGRISPSTVGDGEQYFDQILTAYQVSKVDRVEKGVSQGFIDLYAWDTGRVNSLTILGRYSPDEVDPRYRRITIGCPCQWVRMRYRRKNFDFKSESDWIPLRSKAAIIMMIRAMELYRSEFSQQAENYEKKALQFLQEDQSSVDGADTISIQFNEPIWTNPYEQNMM